MAFQIVSDPCDILECFMLAVEGLTNPPPLSRLGTGYETAGAFRLHFSYNLCEKLLFASFLRVEKINT